MGVIVGVDLGGTFVKAGLVKDGIVVHSGQRTTEANRGAQVVVQNIIDLGRQLLGQAGIPESEVAGVCVAVPSPISADRRTPVAPPNLKCLNDVPVAEQVARAFGCLGVLENDANAAALGEKYYGAAQGLNDFVTLTLGTGLGGGVFSEGRILRGRDNLAGEVGHLVVQPENGRLCGCGAEGCVEAYVSIRGLLMSARETCEHLQTDAQLVIAGEQIDETNGPMVLARLARAGDQRVRQVFRQMGRYLGIAISDLLCLFGPQLVVLSGGISNAFDLFETSLWDSIRRHCGFKALRDPLRIEVSKIKQNAAILGAAAAFIEGQADRSRPLADLGPR